MLKIVDRMILGELSGPLLFGVGLFSVLTIATVVLQESLKFIMRWDLPPAMFFTLVGLGSPMYIILSIPMGALLGTLLSVGRLSNDNEIVALRTCGLSLYRVLAPYFAVGIVLSCITFLGNELIVPYASKQLQDLKNDVITGALGLGQQQRASWTFHNERGQLQWVLVAGEVQGETLSDVVLLFVDPERRFKRFDPEGRFSSFLLEAERAEWDGNSWVFHNYRQMMLYRSESGDEQLIVEGERLTIPDFSISPQSLQRRRYDPSDLTIRQLWKLIEEEVQGNGLPLTDKRVLELRTVLHFKTSIPLTPLFFMIVAVPLAILPARSSRAVGMGLALLTVLVYYALFVVFQKVGTAGVLHPVVSAWVPNALVLIMGLVLMRQREQI